MTRSIEMDRMGLFRILGIIIVCLLLVLITGSKFFYLLTALVLGVLAVNVLILWINILFLSTSFHISASVLTAGETLTMNYKILNNALVPIYHLSVKPVISKELGEIEFDFRHYTFKPYEIQDIERQLKCDKRGFYVAGEIIMKLSDPLKLLTWTMTKLKPIEVTVFPRIYPYRRIRRDAMELFGNRRSVDNRREDQTSIRSVRQFVEGDSARSIHWPLTAKLSELQIKEYSSASGRKTYLFLDGYKDQVIPEIREFAGVPDKGPDHFDEVAEVSASIATVLLKEGVDTVMLINDRHRTECHGRKYHHMRYFLDKLTAYVPDGPLTFSEFLNRESRRFQEGAELVVVCGPLDPVLADTFRSLVKRRFRLVCYSLDASSNGAVWSDKLWSRQLEVYPLAKAADLSRL